jgi:hypothetical protein
MDAASFEPSRRTVVGDGQQPVSRWAVGTGLGDSGVNAVTEQPESAGARDDPGDPESLLNLAVKTVSDVSGGISTPSCTRRRWSAMGAGSR